METHFKEGEIYFNNLYKKYSLDVSNVHISYKESHKNEIPKDSYLIPSQKEEQVEDIGGILEFMREYQKFLEEQKDLNIGFFDWLNPYSLDYSTLSVLNKCLEEHLETGEISLIDESSFNYLVSRHYSEFKDLLMKWAYSLDIGKVTLFNAREALYTTQGKFDLEEKVFIFRKSTFMEKGKLTKFKNISRVDVRHKIVKASMKEEPIFIIKFIGIEPENLVTRYKKEVSGKEFYFYNFILMLMNL